MILKDIDVWQIEASSKKGGHGHNVNAWVFAPTFEDAISIFKREYAEDDRSLHICKCFKVKASSYSRFDVVVGDEVE